MTKLCFCIKITCSKAYTGYGGEQNALYKRRLKMRKVVALRHTSVLPSGELAPDAEKFITAMVPVVVALRCVFGVVLTSTSDRARQTAESLCENFGVALPVTENAILDPPPDEVKKGVPGVAKVVSGIKAYRTIHPEAGVATAILATGGEAYMRQKASAVFKLIGENEGNLLIVAHENGVTSFALEGLGRGYDVNVLGGDFRFVEGVCITFGDDGTVTDVQILRNPAFNS